MPIFYGDCPQCDAGKAVDVDFQAEWQVDPVMGGPVTFSCVTRLPEDDECTCVLTAEEEQAVIDSADDKAVNAEPHVIEPD